jgi:chemotaxis protein MotB
VGQARGDRVSWSKRPRKAPPSEDWITTYADAITLLMAFFVMMFSMSELKQDRFAEFQSAIDAALGNAKAEGLPTPKHAQQKSEKNEAFMGMADNVEGRLHRLSQRGEVRLATDRKGIYVDVYTDHFYEPGGFTIRPEMEEVLDDIVTELRPKYATDYKVQIVGHTDDAPIHTPVMDSNWDLSATRAARVSRYLIESGIDSERLEVVGKAHTDPILPHRNPDGSPNEMNRSKNRRIEIRIEY